MRGLPNIRLIPKAWLPSNPYSLSFTSRGDEDDVGQKLSLRSLPSYEG